jgi:hypothetical protein
VIDYSFPSVNNIVIRFSKKLQVIQNKAVREIFKKYEATPEEIDFFATKLGLMSIPNRLSELNEKYVRDCLDAKNPLIIRLVDEYGSGCRSRLFLNYIEFATTFIIINM